MIRQAIVTGMLVLSTTAFCTQTAFAEDGKQHAPSSNHNRLRMCESADCSVPFVGEPYEWVAKDGRVLNSGVTDSLGYAVVLRARGVTDYALENLNARWDMHVADKCWSENLERCAKLVKTTSHDGFDDSKSIAEAHRDQEEATGQRQQEQKDRLAQYHKLAVANDDELSWLGPLPVEWSDDELKKRLGAVYERIHADLTNFTDQDQAFLSFECKSPEQFGPVPDAAAVTAYIKSQRGDVSPEEASRAWDGLKEAAKQGNWQARQFLYAELGTEIDVRHNDNLALRWRWLQLMEWLQSRQTGSLYGEYIDAVIATGMDGPNSNPFNPAYIFAALHGSYSYMDKVARHLNLDADFDVPQTDPDYQEKLQQFRQFNAVAKSMRDCPHRMMPELFSDDGSTQ